LNKLISMILKSLRKIYKFFYTNEVEKPLCELDSERAASILFNIIKNEKPIMVARFGAFELSTIINYIGVHNDKKSLWKYIQNKEPDWYWNESLINYMHTNAGFFPPKISEIEKFCELMLQDNRDVDILGSWREEERYLLKDMNVEKVHLRFLEPFWSKSPWTRALKDKKVLVVHPFKNTIEKQYEKRELLFKSKDTLPKFQSLTVIRAVQSLGGGNNQFKDWFEALEYMKSEIDKVDYDVCLIGAGAYGFPLAAHVKRKGKQGLHIGGALQLFFGIRGKRWEDQNYGVEAWGIPEGFYSNMMNEYWVRPNEDETPNSSSKVEGACYW